MGEPLISRASEMEKRTPLFLEALLRRNSMTFGSRLLISALALGLASTGAAIAADTALKETGSTLLYPLFQVWAAQYATGHPGVTVTTAATGSGAGIEQAVAGTTEIGTSDAYMSDEQVRQHPAMLNIPMAISAQTINYNLPGLNGSPLKLDGPTLAGIYTGKIRSWDDPAIAALNAGVSLPHQPIIPVRRAEASGDTFIFTQYLTFSAPAWQQALGGGNANWGAVVDALGAGSSGVSADANAAASGNGDGYGTSLDWPAVSGEATATGNDGMVKAIAATPYSIGYIGVSSFADIAAAKLGTAEMKSYDGEFLLPTPETITAAAAALTPRTPPDERLTLVDAPGANAYPLVNYEYAIVSSKQADADTAAALRGFLLWAIAPDEDNDKRLGNTHFIALPAHIWVISHDQIETIK
jgi:phosphate transport system substrate-binding protein